MARIKVTPAEPTRNPLRVLAGLMVSLTACYIAISLFTYNPADPSMNRAAEIDPTNAGGHTGAVLADLALQSMGFAGALLVLVPLAWGIKLLMGSSISHLWIRFVLLLTGLVCMSALFSTMNPPLSWPIASGLGGAIGSTLHDNFYGLFKNGFFIAALYITSLVVSALSFGVSWDEWKGLGRQIRGAMIFTAGVVVALGDMIRARFGRDTSDEYEDEDEDEEEDDKDEDEDEEYEDQPWYSRLIDRIAFWRRDEYEEDEDEEEEDEEDDEEYDEYEEEDEEPAPRRKAKAKPAPAPARKQASLALPEGDYEIPSMRFLATPPRGRSKNQLSQSALTQNARLLESVLRDFGVNGEIVEIRPGPVVTLYELEPAAGTKSSRVVGLADDIARSMSAISARIAVIPGRNAIGIELPNSNRETVYLRDMLENESYEASDAKLPLALGKDIGGAPIIVDLARMPHLLVAGTTGSGKSVAINTMIMSLVYKLTPEQCKFIMIDPKMLELSVYEGIPHLLSQVVTEPGKAVVALKWTVKEMENRYRLMANLGVRNIDGYNKKIREAKAKGHELTRTVQTGFDHESGEPIIEEVPLEMNDLPYIVVIVDEMADLMIVAGKEIEGSIQRLAQMARAAGIHIIMATQRPSVDVITGVIKANFPTRISFQVTSRIDSRTVLGEQGAEQLLGQGDMLYMAGGGRITRVHGPFITDQEVEKVVDHLKMQGEPIYIEDVTRDEESGEFEGEDMEKDALYDQAVAIVIRDQKASTSYVQRCLKIGYNRAASIIDCMERAGIISEANHVGKREVLVQDADA